MSGAITTNKIPNIRDKIAMCLESGYLLNFLDPKFLAEKPENAIATNISIVKTAHISNFFSKTINKQQIDIMLKKIVVNQALSLTNFSFI